jgi:hypothetical protein
MQKKLQSLSDWRVNEYLNVLDTKKITTNTQKVLYRLLKNSGDWAPRSVFRAVPNATARLRELRQDHLGSLPVVCANGRSLGKSVKRSVFYYKLDVNRTTIDQLRNIFKQ